MTKKPSLSETVLPDAQLFSLGRYTFNEEEKAWNKESGS